MLHGIRGGFRGFTMICISVRFRGFSACFCRAFKGRSWGLRCVTMGPRVFQRIFGNISGSFCGLSRGLLK